MYYSKIDIEAARNIASPRDAAPSFGSTALAVLIVLAIPVIALGLLLGAFWRDVKAVGRAGVICIETYAAELARRR